MRQVPWATVVEAGGLTAAAVFIVSAAVHERQDLSTVSGCYWTWRDRSGPAQRAAMDAALAGGLVSLWYHLARSTRRLKGLDQ